MKANALKTLKNISLILLVSGLSLNFAQAQNKKQTKKTVITKVRTTKVNRNTPSVKKVAVQKVVKNTPQRTNNRVITKKVIQRNNNSRFNRLPAKARFVTHRNVKYAYHNGVFYRPQGNAYVVTNRPTGLRINVVL